MKNHHEKDTHPRPNPTATTKPPKTNKFYPLKGREEQKKSDDGVTGTLHIFSFPFYALLDPRSTLSFVSPLVACKFVLLHEIFHDYFQVSTPK